MPKNSGSSNNSAQPFLLSICGYIRNLLLLKSKNSEVWQYLDNRFFMHATSQPLTDATLLIELALQQKEPNSNYTKAQLRQALTQLKYLQSLFHLDTQDTTVQEFNLQRTLNEVLLRLHQPQNGKVVTPVFQLPNNPQILGNTFLFQEAVTCLINNAFESYQLDQENKYVLLTAFEKRGHAVMIIGDTGSGIDALTQKLIHFKGFSHKKSGHGLGVSYAQKIITEHLGGACKLFSYPDLGTLYMISLPLMQ